MTAIIAIQDLLGAPSEFFEFVVPIASRSLGTSEQRALVPTNGRESLSIQQREVRTAADEATWAMPLEEFRPEPAVRSGASSTSSICILDELEAPPQELAPIPQPQEVNVELEAVAWLQELRRLANDSDVDAIRIQRRYAHLSSLGKKRYSRRSTRGSGVRFLGGEEALVSSLDEFCYVKAAEPGFVFSDSAKMLLYRQAVSDAQIRGFWVVTTSGKVQFPPGHGGMYLSDLARRACEGYGFRGHLEAQNRETDLDNWVEDWRAYYRHSRNIVDIGFVEKMRLRFKRWTHKRFGLALPRPPRQ